MAGPVGSQQFVAFGDCVSVCERLVHRARAGEILLSLEFVKAARAEGFAELPIIMITTEGSMEYVTRAIEAGANEYLMKPFTKESLRDKLALLGFETPT